MRDLMGMIFITLGVVFSIVGMAIMIWPKFKPQPTNTSITMERLMADETSNGMRLIRAELSERDVNKAVEDMLKLDAGKNQVEKPIIKQKGKTFFLVLPDNTTYDVFCAWIICLVHHNTGKHNDYDVTGWYEVSSDAKGVWKSFAGHYLMFYIPRSNINIDNIYFTTENDICYIQKFDLEAPLIKHEKLQLHMNPPKSFWEQIKK